MEDSEWLQLLIFHDFCGMFTVTVEKNEGLAIN